MFCKNCGNQLSTDAKFCGKCGTTVAPIDTSEQDIHTEVSPQKKKKVSSIIVIIIVFILFFVGATWLINKSEENKTQENITNYFTDTSSWKEFNSTIGKFKATFPTVPTHETQNNTVPGTQIVLKMDLYTSTMADETGYMIGFSTYPSNLDLSDADSSLEGAVNGTVASNKDNKLVSSNFTYSNGYRAVDYLIQQNDVSIKGRNILVGHTMYILMVAYYGQNYNESNYNKFINSFTLQ